MIMSVKERNRARNRAKLSATYVSEIAFDCAEDFTPAKIFQIWTFSSSQGFALIRIEKYFMRNFCLRSQKSLANKRRFKGFTFDSAENLCETGSVCVCA